MASKSSSLLKLSWDHFTDLLTNRWQSYFWYVVLRFLIGLVFILGVGLLLYGPVMNVLSDTQALLEGSFDWMQFIPRFGIIGLLALITGVVGFVVTVGFYRVAVDNKAEQTASELLSRGTENYFWTLLNFIAFCIIAFIAIGIGFVLLLLPGVYLAIGLSMGIYLVIIDNQGPIEAFKKSRQLVSGQWWSVFGTLLFWIVFSWIVMAIISFVFQTGLASMVDFSTLERLELGLNEQVASQNLEAAAETVKQMFNVLFNTSTIGLFSVQTIVQAIAAIVPMYGFLGVYKALVGKK